jgi:hypothetical protein
MIAARITLSAVHNNAGLKVKIWPGMYRPAPPYLDSQQAFVDHHGTVDQGSMERTI